MLSGTGLIHSTGTLSEPRIYIRTAVAAGMAFFAGGSDESQIHSPHTTDVVDIYDSHRHQWSVTHLSQARTNLAAVSVGHAVIFAGGSSTDLFGAPSNVVDIYSTRKRRWVSTTMPVAEYGMTAIEMGGKAVFYGGTIESSPNNFTSNQGALIYDLHLNRWTVVTPPTDDLNRPPAVVVIRPGDPPRPAAVIDHLRPEGEIDGARR